MRREVMQEGTCGKKGRKKEETKTIQALGEKIPRKDKRSFRKW
jgi:hypothetical protein